MIRFLIEIEAVADDPNGVNIVIKTERNQPAGIEEAMAQRLLPALRNLPKTSFPESGT